MVTRLAVTCLFFIFLNSFRMLTSKEKHEEQILRLTTGLEAPTTIDALINTAMASACDHDEVAATRMLELLYHCVHHERLSTQEKLAQAARPAAH